MSVGNKFLVVSVLLGTCILGNSASAMKNNKENKSKSKVMLNEKEENKIEDEKEKNNKENKSKSKIKLNEKEGRKVEDKKESDEEENKNESKVMLNEKEENKIKDEKEKNNKENKNESKIKLNEKEGRKVEDKKGMEKNLKKFGYGDTKEDQQETKDWLKSWDIDNEEIYNEMKKNNHKNLLECLKKYINHKKKNFIYCIEKFKNEKFCYELVENKLDGCKELKVDEKDLNKIVKTLKNKELKTDVVVNYIKKVLPYDKKVREEIKTYGDLIRKAYVYSKEQNIKTKKYKKSHNIYGFRSSAILEQEYRCIELYESFKSALIKIKDEKEETKDTAKKIFNLHIEMIRLKELISSYDGCDYNREKFSDEFKISLNEELDKFVDELMDITNKNPDVFSFWEALIDLLKQKYRYRASIDKIAKSIVKETFATSFNQKNIDNIIKVLNGSVDKERLEKIEIYLTQELRKNKKELIFRDILKYLAENYRLDFFKNLDYVVENFEMIKEIEELNSNLLLLAEERNKERIKNRIMNAVEKIKENINPNSFNKLENSIKKFIENGETVGVDWNYLLNISDFMNTYKYQFYLYRKPSGKETAKDVKQNIFKVVEEAIEKYHDEKTLILDIKAIVDNIKTAFEKKDTDGMRKSMREFSNRMKGSISEELRAKLEDLMLNRLKRGGMIQKFIIQVIIFAEKGRECFLRNFNRFIDSKIKQAEIGRDVLEILDNAYREKKRELTKEEENFIKQKYTEFYSVDGIFNAECKIRRNSNGTYKIIRLCRNNVDENVIEKAETDSGSED